MLLFFLFLFRELLHQACFRRQLILFSPVQIQIQIRCGLKSTIDRPYIVFLFDSRIDGSWVQASSVLWFKRKDDTHKLFSSSLMVQAQRTKLVVVVVQPSMISSGFGSVRFQSASGVSVLSPPHFARRAPRWLAGRAPRWLAGHAPRWLAGRAPRWLDWLGDWSFRLERAYCGRMLIRYPLAPPTGNSPNFELTSGGTAMGDERRSVAQQLVMAGYRHCNGRRATEERGAATSHGGLLRSVALQWATEERGAATSHGGLLSDGASGSICFPLVSVPFGFGTSMKFILKINERHWKSLKIIERRWKSMKNYGNQWKALEIIGMHWKRLTINENQWAAMEIIEKHWKSLEFIGIHGKSVKLIEKQ